MTPESRNNSLLGNGSVNRFQEEMNMHATIEEPVSKQRFGKHRTTGVFLETVFSIPSVENGIKEEFS
jgi:hypothetical protein